MGKNLGTIFILVLMMKCTSTVEVILRRIFTKSGEAKAKAMLITEPSRSNYNFRRVERLDVKALDREQGTVRTSCESGVNITVRHCSSLTWPKHDSSYDYDSYLFNRCSGHHPSVSSNPRLCRSVHRFQHAFVVMNLV